MTSSYNNEGYRGDLDMHDWGFICNYTEQHLTYYNGDEDTLILLRITSHMNTKTMAEAEPRSTTLYFNPNEHAENPLKAFKDFCDTFLLRY